MPKPFPARSSRQPRGFRAVPERLRDPKTRWITAALLACCLVLVAALGYWIVLLAELPDVQALEASRFEQATIVYTTDGAELTQYHDKNRTWVTLDQISPHVVDALIATEDHRFYDHLGVDVWRTISSVFQTLAGDRQGGSTLTMQFARNAFDDVGSDSPYTRKVKEWITALRLEGLHEKEDILEMYLNTVPFMYNAFGIEAAARTYYQKPASELDVDEAAVLVAMLKGTVLYNPVRNPDRSHDRRNVVLEQMVERGYLEPADYEAIASDTTDLDFRRLSREDNLAPYFAEHLRQWLDEWADANGYNLYTDGLRVYTTIDSVAQAHAAAAVARVTEDLQAAANREWGGADFSTFWARNRSLQDRFLRRSDRYRQLVDEGTPEEDALEQVRSDAAYADSVLAFQQRVEAGLVAIDPATGYVRAWVGGRDFGIDQYDHVAQAKRQPGSTFKPFVYAAALERGFGANDLIRDEAREYVDPDTRRRWRPTNVGSSSGRLMTLADALAYSKNTVTAQLITEIGPERVARLARRMGIESELNPVPSLGLGTSEVSLLELAAAYTAFATNGTRRQPVLVTRIENGHGRVLATFAGDAEPVLSSQAAYTLLDMMRGVVDRGTGQRINRYVSGDLAGKTGTTQNGADGWFVLLHPELVAASWVGFPSPSVHFRSNYYGQGAHNALPIVGTFAQQLGLDAEARFREPMGYVPPAPIDSVRLGEGAARYAGYSVTDSILARIRARDDDPLLSDTLDLRAIERPSDEDDPAFDPLDDFEEPENDLADEPRDQRMEDLEPVEPADVSGADALNRSQQIDDDVLERLREDDPEDEDQ